MANSVTFQIKIETSGGESVRTVTMDARQLGEAINKVSGNTEHMNGRLLDINQAAMAIQNVFNGFSEAAEEVKKLTEAFTVQELAEVKLETIMKQRMSATESDVKSIEKLASAQQKLGVIGDEVQLSGAQQLATFLNQRQSLETLIPAMNNLIAQQKGFNATGEDAVGIGNMMGKAMQGQTGVLQRVGITFTDAQSKIIKYGTEEQRAATLAQVITDNVGQMNERLAQTDAGKAKQLNNEIGDMKERLGAVFASAEPVITALSEVGMSVFAITNVANGVRGMASAFTVARISQMSGTVATRLDAQAKALLSAMNITTTASTWVLRAAMVALYATMTAGVFLAVQGLISLYTKLTEKSDEAAEAEEAQKQASDEASQAQQRESSQLKETRAALEINIQKLKDFHGSKEKEKALTEEMNNTYGVTLGYFSSVAAWYKALTADSAAYCQQMVVEARTRMLANQIAQKEQENHDLRYNSDGSTKRYHTARETRTVASGQVDAGDGTILTTYSTEQVAGSSELDKAQAKVKSNTAAIGSLKKQMQEAAAEAAKINIPILGSSEKPDLSTPKKTKTKKKDDVLVEDAKSYADLSNNIEIWQKKLDATDPSNKKQIQTLSESIQKAKDQQEAIKALQAEYAKPAQLKTLEDYDGEIARQESLFKRAGAEERAGIAASIQSLKDKRDAMEAATKTGPIISEINTYKQLDDAINYYQDVLQNADAATRPIYIAQIAQLTKIREGWQSVDEAANKPAGIAQLNTYKQLDDAINYYDKQAQTAEGDQLTAIEGTVAALNRKRQLLQDLGNLSSGQTELSDMKGLGDKEVTIRLREIGVDGIKKKITDLNKLLSSPSTSAEQAKNIKAQISEWGNYEARLRKSQITFTKTWGDIRSIGDGVKSLTTTLKGNGSAWDKLTGIVDAGIAIFSGISSIIQIVKVLTAAATVEQGTESAAQMVTNSAEAATWSGLAAAKTAAAYAGIPFAGVGLAAAQTASFEAMIIAAAVPKFANGNIAYGPTLAVFGEYANASRNPEVTAPLDKLRALIRPDGMMDGEVVFRQRGRDLVGVYQRRNNLTHRS